MYVSNKGYALGSGIEMDGKYHQGLNFAGSWQCSVGGASGSCPTFGIRFSQAPTYGLFFATPPSEIFGIIDGNASVLLRYLSTQKGFQFLLSSAPTQAISMDLTKGNINSYTVTSRAPTGTPPLSVDSTTEVPNLNAERWHGKQAVDFAQQLHFGPIAAQSCSEQIINTPEAAPGAIVAPAWPAGLETGLFGLMIAESGAVKVRLCNLTAATTSPAARMYGGRLLR